MSLDRSLYIGAFVKCINSVKEIPILKRKCDNPKCWRNTFVDGGYFCAYCGSPTVEFQDGIRREANVNPWDIVDELNDSLSLAKTEDLEVDIWISNLPASSPVRLELSDDDDDLIEIPDAGAMQKDHIDNFGRFYQREIAVLRERYGADKVEVAWGVIQWWS